VVTKKEERQSYGLRNKGGPGPKRKRFFATEARLKEKFLVCKRTPGVEERVKGTTSIWDSKKDPILAAQT